jgi:hypothetical protein
MLNHRTLFPGLALGLLAIATLDAGVVSAQELSRPAIVVATAGSVAPTTLVPSDTVLVAPLGARAASVGFHTVAIAAPASPPRNDASLGAGKNVAMMGVGIAGVITGVIIGGTSGTMVAVGGGVLGLYGLYRFLR